MKVKSARLQQAQGIQYSERAIFYYSHQERLHALVKEINAIKPGSLKWVPQNIGINPQAWAYIQKKHFPAHQVFCHPEVITQSPNLVLYYRALAVLPVKGMQALGFNTDRLEEGAANEKLDPERAIRLSATLNLQISKLITSVEAWTIEKGLMAGVASIGAQVNGSWRNAIGEKAAGGLKEIIFNYFSEAGLVSKIQARGKRKATSRKVRDANQVRSILLKNGFEIIFGSEPDISIRNPDGKLVGAGETKGGLDPAGALERYGAAKKSFENARDENKAVITFYVAACMTETVRSRMSKDHLVSDEFNLLEILQVPASRKKFMEHLRWIAHC